MKGAIKISAEHTGDKLAKGFENLVQSLKVPFRIYESVVHGSVQIEHSSLTGVHWRRLLERIGPAILNSSGLFPEEQKGRLAALFTDFNELLAFAGKCKKTDAAEVARKADLWGKSYVSMGWSVTPYVHLVTVHLAHSVSLFGGLDKLSGEWVEAANDDMKKTHLRKTHHRSPKLTLQTQLRIELQAIESKLENHHAPRKRKERPQNPQHGERMREWEKRRRIQEEEERDAATTAVQSPYESLSVDELKAVIFKKTGKKTRKQNRQSLLDILLRVDNESVKN